MLLPILQSVDGEHFSFFPQSLDVEVVRYMHHEAICDFAPRNSASFFCRLDEPGSKLRHGAVTIRHCRRLSISFYCPERFTCRAWGWMRLQRRCSRRGGF